MAARPIPLSLAAAALVGALFFRSGLPAEAVQRPRLPGARAVVDAAEYASLQDALLALPAKGGVVKLPPGEFELREPLILEAEDVLLQGSGTATHLINRNADGKPALIIRPKTYATDPRAHVWRVQVSNLQITGSDKSGHGIEAIRVNELFIDGISVSRNGGDGLHLNECTEDPRIVNSLLTYNKKAGVRLLGCHDIVVSANQFEENQDALVCADGFNLCMTGNNVDDHLRHGVVIENTYGSVLSGNMIEECNGTAVVLDRDCYGITVSANVIAHEQEGGVDLRDAHGCAITGNSFPLVIKNAVTLSADSGNNTIAGNTFGDSTVGTEKKIRQADQNRASGIILQGARGSLITGNTFGNLTQPAFEVKSAGEDTLIRGNLLRGSGGVPAGNGITADGNTVRR